MADPVETDLETPVADLPEKPFYLSNSFWAAALAVAAGILQQNDKLAPIAQFLNANKDELVGWVMTGLGLWAMVGTLTRTTTLTKGK